MPAKPPSPYLRYLGAIGNILPVALPAAAASFSVVAMFFLVIGRFDGALVWPFGLSAAIATFIAVAFRFRSVNRPGSLLEQVVCDMAVLGGAAAWTFVNAHYAAQDIFVTRDPAVYANAGTWLIHHDSLHIPAATVFSGLNGAYHAAAGQGFGYEVGNHVYIYAQGLHLLPAWFGLAGRIGGETFAFGINAAFGALALLAVYAFARLLGRPRFALLGALILSISLPLIYFSRDTYTEPLAMLFTFSALTLLWGAQRTNSYILWGLAGLTASAGVLTRTDAYLTLAALILFVAVVLALAKVKLRRETLKRAGVFIACAIPPAIIGWFDLTHLSSGYYRDLHHQVKQEIAFVFLVAFMSAVLVAVAWKTTIIKSLDDLTAPWRTRAVMTLAVLVLIGMASRPLWYVGHEIHVPLIGGLQAAAGHPVDDTRSYSEQTVNWIGWYIGPLMAAFGGLGLLLALWRFVKKGDLLILPGLLVVAITSLVFLNIPNISPDQIWASRRLLPVILPGMVVFGVMAMDWLDGRSRYRYKQALWVVAVQLLIILPLFISYPFLRLKTYTPQLAQMDAICSSLPADAAVIWIGKMKLISTQSTNIFCGVPAAGVDGTDRTQLGKAAETLRSRGRTLVVGLTAPEREIYFPGQKFTGVNTVTYSVMEETLYHPPRYATTDNRTVILGAVKSDGTIVPLGRNK